MSKCPTLLEYETALVPVMNPGKCSYGSSGWYVDMSRNRMDAAKFFWPEVIVQAHKSRTHRNLINANRVYRAVEQLRQFIDIDPEKRGGAPVLRGTRFKLSQLFSQLAEGDSIEDLVDDMELDGEVLRDLFNAMSVIVDRPTTNELNPA